MSDQGSTNGESATAEEIREWEDEHDEPHPVFEVEHRPERVPVGRRESTTTDVTEYGDRLGGAVATMRGEADELAARRPHPDAHLYDIEEGLRFRAGELDAWLTEHDYE